jgi:hypothetical protein
VIKPRHFDKKFWGNTHLLPEFPFKLADCDIAPINDIIQIYIAAFLNHKVNGLPEGICVLIAKREK